METEPNFAVIVALVFALTALVATENVAVVAPDATFTGDATVAFELLLVSVTLRPDEGAAPFKVTVPVEEVPPTTELGDKLTDKSAGGVIVNETPIVDEPRVPEILAVALLVTAEVETVKVAEVEPAAMTMLELTFASVEELASLIVSPPVGAGELISTVPVAVEPPVTLVGLTVTEESVGALILSVAELELEPSLAAITAVVFLVTGVVVTLKVAEFFPDATFTDEPTTATELADDRLTSAPELPAALERVTVPVEDEPPATLAGLRLTFVTVWPGTIELKRAKIPAARAERGNKRIAKLRRIMNLLL